MSGHAGTQVKQHDLVVIIPFFNEGPKIRRVLHRIRCLGDARSFDVLFVNDGSYMSELELRPDEFILSHTNRKGVGAAIRSGIDWALAKDYEFIGVMAGNDKDNPAEVAALKQSLVRRHLDLIQGSRFLQRNSLGPMPLYRRLGTRIFSFCFSLFAGAWITDATNGFRIVRTGILRDPKIQLHQEWLNHYELEPYLLYKSISLGYAVGEKGCSKRYPERREGQTKMRPFSGWWSLMRPLVLLRLGLRQ